VTGEQIMRIKSLAAAGLRTHEIHGEDFPGCELWEIHNVIHFDGRCESKQDLMQNILKQYPDLAKSFREDRRPEDMKLKVMILSHEGRITETKFRASESHRKHRGVG
jgi:hypothetical protein